ncbi:MAG: hypothetical protein Q8Q49_05155 [bacterium]|nr:hypothetical protein [bacterium]
MAHSEFLNGPATLSRRRLFTGAALAASAAVLSGVAVLVTDQNDNNGTVASLEPTVPTTPASVACQETGTAKAVDLFNGNNLPAGMQTGLETPIGTSVPKTVEGPTIPQSPQNCLS